MRVKSALVAVAMVASAGFTAVLPGTPALAVSCPDNAWTIKDGRTGLFFNASNVNIRTGPSTSCPSRGQGQPNHIVQLDCWKTGDGGTWSHLFDETIGVEGWSRDDLLIGGGANSHC